MTQALANAQYACRMCGESKPRTEEFFPRNRRSKDGLYAYCRPCNSRKAQEWQAAHPHAMVRYQASHNIARKARRADADYALAESLRDLHSLSLAEYRVMETAQANLCAICGRRAGPKDRLQVDHDHASGRIRGLLCGSCNKGLGLFGDDPQRLRSALRYLGTIALAEAIGS